MTVLLGSAGNDVLTGTGADDSLDGLVGADKLAGGLGNDTYSVDNPGDQVIETPTGGTSDTIIASISLASLAANVEVVRLIGAGEIGAVGNAGDNAIFGNMAANTIDGGSGNDGIAGGLGGDTLSGGAGNDKLFANSSLLSSSESSGNFLDGGSGDDSLTDASGHDVLIGGAGNDSLDGRGATTMKGGAGDDIYYVHGTGVQITELSNQGTDTIASTAVAVDLTVFGANIENLLLLGAGVHTGFGNALDNAITGGAGIDTLTGAAGNDLLNGAGGDDTMTGGDGNDAYYVDSNNDTVVELAGGGTDLVQSSADKYVLAAYVENLVLFGTGDIKGTGNDLANIITGNSGNNTLAGGDGADTLIGGDGNDSYILAANDAADKLVETAKGGSDAVFEAFADYTLGANLENLFVANGGSNAKGNALANQLNGNDAANTLDGAAGDDFISGGFGNDVLLGGAGDDHLDDDGGTNLMAGGAGNDTYLLDGIPTTITELANQGTDTVVTSGDYILPDFVENLIDSAPVSHIYGNALNNVITESGHDVVVIALDGNDTLISHNQDHVTLVGGKGDDTYYAVGGNTVVERPDEGKDLVISEYSFILTDNVENLQLLGPLGADGLGNALANVITGNAAQNKLEGGGGSDTLIGGAGNDTYILDAGDAADKVVESINGGIDFLHDSLTAYTLAANVEFLYMEAGAVDAKANALDNTIQGNSDANTISGDGGNDRILAGDGKDAVSGGAGNDTLFGNGNDDVLDGGAGNDALNGQDGADVMKGGAGDDDYTVDNSGDQVIELANQGNDTIHTNGDYNLMVAGANVENLVLEAGTLGIGNDLDNEIYAVTTINNVTLHGGKGDDSLSCAGAGTLYGEAGDDVLGTSDANVFNLDTEMHGGVANDTYIVNDFQDLVVESDGEGTDLVQAFISYTLIGSVENLRLMGSDGINGTGNGLANVITGNEQANVLTGGDGNDTLVGLGGDDVYVLGAGDAADKIVEAAKGGSDTVQTSLVSTILAANVEVLQLQSGALNGTGNALDNEIDGTTGANTLDGAAGNDFLEGDAGDDQLIGGAGNDRLIGGDGSDAMTGGSGNDFYLVADAGDTVVEAKSQGTDEILALFDFDLSISGVNVENLTLFALGSGVTGSGNDLDNVIAGNSADNVLSGGKGDDTLQGDLGADTLDGGAGDDSLDGGKGDDAMAGGIGDDTYFVNSAGDGITEIPGAGTDLVVASVGWTLGAALENLTLTGGVGLIGIGNELANVITGTEGNDSLRGGAGNDTLIGGAGNDTYVLAAGDLHDKITEAANGGTDTVLSALDHTTLGANLEKLTLQGSGVDGTGNALDNALHGDALDNHLDGAAGNDNLNGGAGDDTLTGGAGDDTLNDDSGADHMIGGAGNDSYVVDDINDAVTELANLGTDIVTSLVSFNLAVQGANVENLSLSGGGNISGTGNDLANVITGNAGSNAIDGEKGADTLVGLDGNDFLFGGDGNDVIEGDRGADVLNGGDGGDVFLFRLSGVGALADIAGDTIQDFQTGEDRIDIRDLFDTYGIGSSSDPFADGHLALEASGGNTLVKFDSDGGGDSYVVLATATNATVAAADVVF